MKYPLISVIVPSVGRDTLVRTIQSILETKYPNFEILVSASGDGVTGIANKLNFPHTKLVWWNSQKVSPAKAKNEAIKHANGKYITFLDDDDTCYPEKFFALTKHLEEHPDTLACFGQYNVRDCYSNKIINTNCGGNGTVCFDTLIQNNYIASGSVMYRNLDRIYFDETIDFGEDWMMNLRLISKCKFAFIPVVVYAWTKNLKSGYTAKYNRAKINWRRIVENNRKKAIKLWKQI